MDLKSYSLLFLVVFSSYTFSHGGGLNADGCHNERKTGGFHCHRSTHPQRAPSVSEKIEHYDRRQFNYRGYKSDVTTGFYTGKECSSINIDHVVSLKDAYSSGAAAWDASKKEVFANDKANHVPSCGRVNSSKGSTGPKDFLRRSNDGKGLEYTIIRFCDYVERYHRVKVKYGLSFTANSTNTFASCGIAI